MIVLDAYSDPKNNICVLWCAHLPGLIIHCYVTYMSFMKFQGAQLFDDLNHYFNLIRERLAIKMQQSVNASWNHRQDCICELHKIFKMHFRLTKVIKKLHSIYSNEYLLLVNLTMHGIILLTYIIILDLLRFRGQLGLYPREHYFTEYWILVEILGNSFNDIHFTCRFLFASCRYWIYNYLSTWIKCERRPGMSLDAFHYKDLQKRRWLCRFHGESILLDYTIWSVYV